MVVSSSRTLWYTKKHFFRGEFGLVYDRKSAEKVIKGV